MIALALALLAQDNFGTSAVLLPDVDGDGHADLGVLAAEGLRGARLWLISGRGLRVLKELRTGWDLGGPTICSLGSAGHDFDDDGICDLQSRWYIPDEGGGRYEVRILDAKDPSRTLQTFGGGFVAFGPDLDQDGSPDPTFVEHVRAGTYRVTSRNDRGESWRWEFGTSRPMRPPVTWIPDTSGDEVSDAVVPVSTLDGVVFHVLDGMSGEIRAESLLPVPSLLIRVEPCQRDWNGDGLGDFFLGAIDLREPAGRSKLSPPHYETRILLVSGADLSVVRSWKHSEVFPDERLWFDRYLGYELGTIVDAATGEETCLAGEPELLEGGCFVAITEGSHQIHLSEQGDATSFGGLIRPGADWNGDGTADYLAGCRSPDGRVPEYGFLEVRDGRSHAILAVFRQPDLVPSHDSTEPDDAHH